MRFLPTCAAAAFMATATYADGLCDMTLENDDLVGNYTVELGPGTLTTTVNNGQRVHPVPLDTGTATIALYDGIPVLHSDNIADAGVLEIEFSIAGEAEKDPKFLDETTFEVPNAEDIALVLECETAQDLPQLTGIGSVTGNGVVVPNSSRLIIHQLGDDGFSAVGTYHSTFSPPGSGGTVVFDVRISLTRN